MRFFSLSVVVFIIMVASAGCATYAHTQGKHAPAAASAKGELAAVPAMPPKIMPYRINVGDVIEVSVWRTKDMDKDVIVRPDGVISYPLVGDVPVVGLTLTELDRKLTTDLKAFIRNPIVSIAIKKFGGTKVIILGEVKAPGVYTPSGQGSVLELIALAGGFTDDGVRSRTLLIRGGLESPRPIPLNLAAALARGDQDENPPLMPNDIVYVPKSATASFNYIMKQITPVLSNFLLGTTIANDFGWRGTR
ncbi:MAG: polysaccharide biosynthesis/export family protein [Pseudomonadota bacterium]